MIKTISKISKDLKSKFYFNYDTSQNVWFRAGGRTSIYCIVYDELELEFIIKEIRNIPYIVIGAGSNLLIRDAGYQGIIFKLGKKFNTINLNQSSIEVGAGILDVNFSKFAALNGIKDFEFYSGIPGTIGGAIKMNAGCYGKETKDNLQNIKILNSEGKINILNKDQINLKYRSSNLLRDNIIISANYFYSFGDKEDIKKKMIEIKNIREKTQPLRQKTSGSSFKNPRGHFAAQLIEMSGCKGLNVGDAYVSEKHANFLINKDKASASQIERLGNLVIEKVYKKFHIKLEWEIHIMGLNK